MKATTNVAAREKRAANVVSSKQLLRERGIAFTTHNEGRHLVIRQGERTFDFWPSRGTWRERVTSATPGSFGMSATNRISGRGVFNLLKQLGEQKQ